MARTGSSTSRLACYTYSYYDDFDAQTGAGNRDLSGSVSAGGWLKAVTVASVFMPAGQDTLVNALQASLIGALVGAPCNATWALFGISIRRWLKDPRMQRAFNFSMGAILFVLALSFLR